MNQSGRGKKTHCPLYLRDSTTPRTGRWLWACSFGGCNAQQALHLSPVEGACLPVAGSQAVYQSFCLSVRTPVGRSLRLRRQNGFAWRGPFALSWQAKAIVEGLTAALISTNQHKQQMPGLCQAALFAVCAGAGAKVCGFLLAFVFVRLEERYLKNR